MNNSIGEMAGKVWTALDNNGEMTIAKIKNEIKADVFTLNAAIGWLAREGKLDIAKKGNSIKAKLVM
jgi:hypothetical protein